MDTAPHGVTAPVTVRRWLALGLGAVVVAQVLRLLALALASGAGRDLAAGRISEEAFESDLTPLLASETFLLATQVVTAVLSVVWLYRLLTALEAAEMALRWTPGWAIAGWFTPPLVYVVPALILDEVWSRLGGRRCHPAVWVWFVLYGVTSATLLTLSIVGDGWAPVNRDDRPLAEYGAALADNRWLASADAVATIAAAAAWFVVTRSITRAAQRSQTRSATGSLS